MTIREMWRRMTATRYTRALEAEVARQGAEIARLRAENRALLNSILGIAGIPPIPVERPEAVRGPGAASSAPTNDINSAAGESARQKPRPDAITPIRRRSWQQITRMLEFESARKAVASD